jgi:biofilm PGA synthesis N-glycosyltransferase PgaC
MMPVEICFWIAAVAVVYPYALYPVLAWALARLRGRPVNPTRPAPRSASVVVAAHNEEENIARRLDEMTALLTAAELDAEVIVVTDGSTDATAVVARAHPSPMVRVLELPAWVGKAAVLSEGCAVAVHEVLVFADVRQSWAVDALPRMLSNFMDPAVGAVSGDLVVTRSVGVLGGVGLYWRFEKWLRRQESRLWSGVGATGAISAVRRELFRPIPRGTILDDVYWPMQVALQGYRVVHDDRAHAFDRLPDRTCDEFRRKVRTLSGCLQLTARLPAVLSPWRNPVWLQFVSHKLLRLLAPWGLLVLFVTSLLAPGPFYRTVFACQAVCYLAALLGLWTPAGRWRPFAAASSFLVLNGAAWVAFWVWAAGRTEGAWVKAAYQGQGSGVRGQGSANTRPAVSGNAVPAVLTPGP